MSIGTVLVIVLLVGLDLRSWPIASSFCESGHTYTSASHLLLMMKE